MANTFLIYPKQVPYFLQQSSFFDTLEKDEVTIRDRDTMKQERVKVGDLLSFLNAKLA